MHLFWLLIIKTLRYGQDVLFPGRGYKRKFDEMSERLGTLEKEVKRLRSVSEDVHVGIMVAFIRMIF